MKRFAPALLLLSAVGVVACEGTDLDTAATSTTQAISDDITAETDAPPPPPHGPPPGHCAPPLTDDARAVDEAARAAFHANHGEHRGHRPPPPDGAPRGRGPGHRHGDPLLAVYDDDADGTLNDVERAARDADVAAGCTARNAEAVAAFDVDGDALLNASEWAAAREAHHAEHRARFDRRNTDAADDDVDVVATWDADGDGVLSISERRALNTTLRSLVREGLRLPRSAFKPVTTKMATADASETVVEERP